MNQRCLSLAGAMSHTYFRVQMMTQGYSFRDNNLQEGEKEGQGRERDPGEGGRRQMEEEKAQSWATPGHSGEEAMATHTSGCDFL